MKKFAAILIALCMVIGVLPVISFANSTTIKAVRTAFFSSNGKDWMYEDGDNILASTGATGWGAADSFTDLDGSTVSQSSLSGTNFGSARHSLIAFELPEDFDAGKTTDVTLTMKVKNVRQVSSGVRLAVYGNSVDKAWSTDDSTSIFGVSGSVSGLDNCELLGLTDAIKTGNSTGESASGEIITLSSQALTEYVCRMAREGKREVTLRLAAPLGGIRVYSYSTADAPTLTVEEGDTASVKVSHVFYDGDSIELEETVELTQVALGSTFTYDTGKLSYIEKNGAIYVLDEEKSSLSTVADSDGGSVRVAYGKFDEEKHSFNGYEIDDEGAWCWFGDPRSISYKNEDETIDITIIGYIDVHGNIKATQINNLTDKVDEVLIRTNLQPDDHNNPSFLVLPDERIIVFYSRHTDEKCFWYRVTQEPGDLTTLGEEKCLETESKTTYPSPFMLSDDPDNIYLCWRGIEWHPTIAKLSLPDENDDIEFTFGPYQIVRSTNAGSNVRPYAKYASNGKDKIYMSYTSTHPDNVSENWLYFNQIDINTMTVHDINGTLMRTIENGPLIVDHSEQKHIVDKTGSVINWLWQVAVAKDGTPVIANVRINGSRTSHDYYYVKWDGSKWVKTFITNAGGKFHSSDTEYCYSGGMSLDVDNPNVMYCSKPVEGVFGKVFEIFKYTMSADGTEIVEVEQITYNSKKNNVRPWAIPGSEGDRLRVIWMNGDYYYWLVTQKHPGGYPTAAMAEVPLPAEEAVDINRFIASEDYEEIGGAFISTTGTANNVWDETIDGEFAVSASVYLDGDYEGKILDMGNVKLSVKKLDTRYAPTEIAERPRVVLTVDGVDYVTTNVYGTSDDWENHYVQTNGEYFFTKYDRYVNHTISYDGEYLTLYRDGLIDLKKKISLDGIEKVNVGGFDGLVKNVYVYDSALNHDEISALAEAEYAVEVPDAEPDGEVKINYVVYEGELSDVREAQSIKPSETVGIYPGTDLYEFIADETIVYDGFVYTLEKSEFDENTKNAYGVYRRNAVVSGNLVPDGSFEDENGAFSWGTWQSPKTGGYYKDECEDGFYKVNRDTNEAKLYNAGTLTAENYALGTRWNDSSLGKCSLANFIEVEKGKTYYVAYDYKHTAEENDAAYISTAFVETNEIGQNASGSNIPMNVSTDWQTNEFVITAPEDGYIYFHFSWLGSSDNAGNGPYWYFDSFVVKEIKPEIISAKVKVTNEYTNVSVTNLTDEDISGLKIYAASCDENAVLKAAVEDDFTVTAEEMVNSVTFNGIGGRVKVFFWDENMAPVYFSFEAEGETVNVNNPEAPVMVVTKVSDVVINNKDTLKITGVTQGETVAIEVDPKYAAECSVSRGNVIIYALEGGLATDIKVLFNSTGEGVADGVTKGFENILSDEYSDEFVTIHSGEIEAYSNSAVTIGGYSYAFAEACNIIVVDYSAASVSIKAGVKEYAKPDSRYEKQAFVKTVSGLEGEISDIVIFIKQK